MAVRDEISLKNQELSGCDRVGFFFFLVVDFFFLERVSSDSMKEWVARVALGRSEA